LHLRNSGLSKTAPTKQHGVVAEIIQQPAPGFLYNDLMSTHKWLTAISFQDTYTKIFHEILNNLSHNKKIFWLLPN